MSSLTNKEKKQLALNAHKSTGSKVIYVNSQGECFTNSNYAELSDKKENILSFDFSQLSFDFSQEENLDISDGDKTVKSKDQDQIKAAKAKEQEEARAAKAKETLLKKISTAKTPEAVKELVAGYEEDKDVLDAIEEKVL